MPDFRRTALVCFVVRRLEGENSGWAGNDSFIGSRNKEGVAGGAGRGRDRGGGRSGGRGNS